MLIIPVDDLSNAAAEGVAHNIRGTMALPHPYGRLQFGEDLALTFRTLAGQGRNPNCAAAIVIGIEPNWTNRIVKEIEKTGKPVAGFAIERNGDHKTIEAASRKAKEFVHYATELKREPFTVKDLTMSTKCGESDTTSGLASNPTVGRTFERPADAGATLIFGETTEALSLAGGLTPYASENDIKIMRRGGVDQQVFRFRYGDVQKGKDLKQNLLLQRGDVVMVP